MTRSMDRLGLLALVIPALLFIVFLWFLVSPILRNRDILAPAAGKSKVVDTEGLRSPEDQHEKAAFLNWIRWRSSGRFAVTESNHNACNIECTEHGGSEAHHRFSLTRLFARNSLTPRVVPVVPPPTPTPNYSSPLISSPLARPPLECLPHGPGGMLNVPRIFVPARRISLRSYSTSALPSTMTTLPPQMQHSASDSETSFASSSRTSRLASWLTVPSKAFLPALESGIDKMSRTLSETTFSERDIRSNGVAFPF